jgi:flagellar protein FlaI
MLDLLVNALRMRPDRIILGEMRKKPQAEVLFEAMHTGHSVYATVHADSVISTIQRLTNPPIEVPANLLSAVNMNVVMFRNRRENIRRIFQAGEFLPSEEEGKSTIKANIIYRWNAATDNIEPHNKPIRLLEDFSRFTGLNELEIKEDIAKKKKVLEWMVKHNLRDSASVGKVFNAYYLDPEYIVSAASKNNDPKKIIEDLKV